MSTPDINAGKGAAAAQFRAAPVEQSPGAADVNVQRTYTPQVSAAGGKDHIATSLGGRQPGTEAGRSMVPAAGPESSDASPRAIRNKEMASGDGSIPALASRAPISDASATGIRAQ